MKKRQTFVINLPNFKHKKAQGQNFAQNKKEHKNQLGIIEIDSKAVNQPQTGDNFILSKFLQSKNYIS